MLEDISLDPDAASESGGGEFPLEVSGRSQASLALPAQDLRVINVAAGTPKLHH
jgi:hypothetical protein